MFVYDGARHATVLVWMSKHNFHESIFFFHYVEPGIELRLIVIYTHVGKCISYIILTKIKNMKDLWK